MGLELRLDGGDLLRQVATQIRAEGDKGLGREMSAALSKAVAPLGKAIGAEAGKVAPSGYSGVLTRSLKHRRTARTSTRQASLRLTTYADGQTERRDIPAIDRGDLRHPVFGRRRKPWTVTRIQPGFYDRGIRQAGDLAEKQALAVLDDFADRLAKG